MALARRLQIGMWNGYMPDHWSAYGSPRINGIEIAQFKDEAQIAEFTAFCEANRLEFGIHTPLLKGQGYSLPSITSVVSDERLLAFHRLEQEASIASRCGADYLLVHYPYPSVMPRRRSERHWAILPEFERYESDQMDAVMFRDVSRRAFEQVAVLQERYGQRIVLEYDFFGDLQDEWVRAFEEFPGIGMVLDFQRLDVHKRTFPGFEPEAFIEAVADRVYLAHYSNTRYEEGRLDRHLPVLPEQQDDPTYGDAYTYLKLLAQRNDKFHVLLEHNPAKVTRDELERCYESVAAVLALPAAPASGPAPAR
ncbi:TIM barrel protein [Paenibacillus koleovorans]|uniref:TIM barrel protein n=1 Tax=Paenibacillus koleovorans TaxID=121608 RepID=UPI0013E2B938|nr:TIM barrel protein [Paenibacillus koleovorans]